MAGAGKGRRVAQRPAGQKFPWSSCQGSYPGRRVWGQVQTGGQVRTEASAASSEAPRSARASLSLAYLSFPLYNKTGMPPTLDVRSDSPLQTPRYPIPTTPALDSFTGVWGDLVVAPWTSYSLMGRKCPRQKGTIRNLLWGPLTTVREHGLVTGGTSVSCSGPTHL